MCVYVWEGDVPSHRGVFVCERERVCVCMRIGWMGWGHCNGVCVCVCERERGEEDSCRVCFWQSMRCMRVRM